MLGPLEKLGLVVRQDNPTDARVALTEPTDHGRRLVADATVTAQGVAERFVAASGVSAEELAALTAVLARATPAGHLNQ